jgi:hypothetical protein
MLNNRLPIWILFIFALVFQLLFYNHNMGLNCLFLLCLSSVLIFIFNKAPATKTTVFIHCCCWLSAFSVVLAHTTYSVVFFWISFIIYLSTAIHHKINYFHFVPLFIYDAVKLIPQNINQIVTNSFNLKQNNRLKFWIPLIIIPFIVLLVLVKLYSLSNIYFETAIDKFLNHIFSYLSNISIGKMALFILGFIIGIFFITKFSIERIISKDLEETTNLVRKRTKQNVLKYLNRKLLRINYVGVGLFILLNLLILTINYLDIKYIWIDFKWNGGFLKDMVHQGTYLLIVAVLISIGISLYYLNSNLVFLKNNKPLKNLIIIWLVQNIIMIISVAYRNSYYIKYFALAYKRIFVYYFLVACLFGIVSIIFKTIKSKNTAFLLVTNSISIYIIFLSAALINWDKIIAKYNFSNYKTAYIHYSFLQDLNDSALPYLETNKLHLHEIDSIQASRFIFDTRGIVNSDEFSNYIELRKKYFIADWKNKSWLEWNWPESDSYNKLR